MLRSLRIQNFALIDNIELNFNAGYSVITGETGSGKSILLAALNLILGERSDFSVIGPNSDKAVVEADFLIKGFELESFFQENDLDFADLTLIRREISTSGKSRAFVNDTPVSLGVLREFTGRLVNINSQYNTLELKSKTYQLEVVDTLADLHSKRLEFTKRFKIYNEKNAALKELRLALSNVLQQQDYTKFQLEELDELQLDQNDFSKIESELNKAENGENILQTLSAVNTVIDNDDQILDKLRSLRSILDKNKGVDNTIDQIAERIQTVMIELSDISADAARMSEMVEIDPEKALELTNALNKYNHVLRKHNLRDQEELIVFRDKLENEILDAEETQNQINLLEGEIDHLQSELNSAANDLHNERLNSISAISVELQTILEELKLPNTKLDFQLTKRDELNQYGCSDVTLLFSANMGIPKVSIEKAASGGELSRVMLALQKMISEKKLLPTVLFDEIDTGVSGDVAQKIGSLLQKMGTHFQLLAISHLPQVAAKATHHFKVEKQIVQNRTVTKVSVLNEEERVEEIARLMSGEQITEAAIQTAKALMN
jgi:DNA repair protein RecN (Recombination protein N)